MAPKAGHAIGLPGLRVSGEICEHKWASGANAAEVLQLCAHIEIMKQVRQITDLDITHPCSTAIDV
ncbi:MAG: hypothetical protein ACKPKO_06695, partial [Candidatus Fonsibacter sp.]